MIDSGLRGAAVALQGNTSHLHRLLATARGGSVLEERPISWAIGGSAPWRYNSVLRCQAKGREAEQLVARFVNALDEYRASGSWYVSGLMKPRDISNILVDHGFDLVLTEPGMSRDLVGDIEISFPSGFKVLSADGGHVLNDYQEVTAAGFESAGGSNDFLAALSNITRIDKNIIHCVGYVAGEPVSAGTAVITGDTAGIYFVSTLSDFRGKGYGSAVTEWLLRTAQSLGCGHAVLTSSRDGLGVYTRLGFRQCLQFDVFKHG